MGAQSARQATRRAELETQAQPRKERADGERRISTLGADVMVALDGTVPLRVFPAF